LSAGVHIQANFRILRCLASLLALALLAPVSSKASTSGHSSPAWTGEFGPLAMRHPGFGSAEPASANLGAGLERSLAGAESGMPHTSLGAPGLPSAPWFALISTAGVATAYQLDRHVWQTYSDTTTGETHRVADAVAKLGDLRYLAPALLASFAFGKASSQPGIAAASLRIGVSTLGAGATSVVVKAATGRARPNDAPGDPNDFEPFHGDASFPSGHATVAFAFASALDEETQSKWVPWIAYPAAAAVGWARIVQDRHWLSDVVAGSALGLWTGHEFDARLQRRANMRGLNASPLVDISSKRGKLGVQIKF
jgi:membrane-associated phospholipid phosphatase